jgi:hypothetical protein
MLHARSLRQLSFLGYKHGAHSQDPYGQNVQHSSRPELYGKSTHNIDSALKIIDQCVGVSSGTSIIEVLLCSCHAATSHSN